MDADLDLLLIAVYCTADGLLPIRAHNARHIVTDAEVITLCVVQAIMGIPSDRRFLLAARKRLGHLFRPVRNIGTKVPLTISPGVPSTRRPVAAV